MCDDNRSQWSWRIDDLDFHIYLPIFCDGLREVDDPYRFLAVQGVIDMIEVTTSVLPWWPATHHRHRPSPRSPPSLPAFPSPPPLPSLPSVVAIAIAIAVRSFIIIIIIIVVVVVVVVAIASHHRAPRPDDATPHPPPHPSTTTRRRRDATRPKKAAPDKVLPVVPQIVMPLKAALSTRDPTIICPVLKIVMMMVRRNPTIGLALVPYYRQLLPIFGQFKARDWNVGDAIDYSQRARLNVGELIVETLGVLEYYGGPDAFINIKYMIPTYESCLTGV